MWQDLTTDKIYISWNKYGNVGETEAWDGIVRTIQHEDGSIRYPDRRDIDVLNRFNLAKRKTYDIVNDIDEPQKKKKIESENKTREKIEEAVDRMSHYL